jgi:hypothetical protein
MGAAFSLQRNGAYLMWQKRICVFILVETRLVGIRVAILAALQPGKADKPTRRDFSAPSARYDLSRVPMPYISLLLRNIQGHPRVTCNPPFWLGGPFAGVNRTKEPAKKSHARRGSSKLNRLGHAAFWTV